MHYDHDQAPTVEDFRAADREVARTKSALNALQARRKRIADALPESSAFLDARAAVAMAVAAKERAVADLLADNCDNTNRAYQESRDARVRLENAVTDEVAAKLRRRKAVRLATAEVRPLIADARAAFVAARTRRERLSSDADLELLNFIESREHEYAA